LHSPSPFRLSHSGAAAHQDRIGRRQRQHPQPGELGLFETNTNDSNDSYLGNHLRLNLATAAKLD
jgi:hypothetical protein